MLVLWQFEQCPYCQHVRRKLTDLDVKVPALWNTATGELIDGDDAICRYLDEQVA